MSEWVNIRVETIMKDSILSNGFTIRGLEYYLTELINNQKEINSNLELIIKELKKKKGSF